MTASGGLKSRASVVPAAHQSARPRASLCIPAYQAELFLQTTLDSVLAQTYRDLEIVIVDNNSSDRTSDIVARIDDDRVRVVRNPATLSMADNFNLAVSLCKGEYVKLVCADDVLQPDCVAVQVAELENHPEVALVAAKTDFIDEDGVLLSPARGLNGIEGRRPSRHVVREIVRSGRNLVGAPVSTMFRRRDFERCGGFSGEFQFIMDVDLWVRLLHHGEFSGVPQTLAAFRIRTGSTTSLTSARSQLGQQMQLVSHVHADRRWNLTGLDKWVARFNACDMQAKRSALFWASGVRTNLRRRRSRG